MAMRFANPIFEPVWNRHYVDHVAITVAETLGVEHRAPYYEHAGALRDMVQNHLLQLLCLVAMEPPVAYDADDIRDRKMDVMHALRPIDHDEVPQVAARGQYGAGWMEGTAEPAYRDEPGVDPRSNTETFAALKLQVDNWRWQEVPFFLRTGKRLTAAVSEISIRFRDVPHRAFPASVGLNAQPVRLVMQLQPQEGIVLKFMAKEPGSQLRLRPVDMRFSYAEAFNRPVPDAYETLLWDVMVGDATLFMRADQVESAWRLLTPVLEVWGNNPAPDFPNYRSGSWGPEAAEALIARNGRNWLTPTLPRDQDNASESAT
jgi:glucose-6-phosphate 1-dehydrogenase